MSDGVRFYSAGPLSVFVIIFLIALLIIFIPLLVLGIIGAAFTRLGFSWITALVLVLLMLSGSFVNIPVYHIRRDMIRLPKTKHQSLTYVFPVHQVRYGTQRYPLTWGVLLFLCVFPRI